MTNQSDAQSLIGATAYDESGSKLGKIGQVFLDDESGEPEFITVNTGLFGTSESYVPIANATRTDDDSVTLPFSKDKVKDAPHVDVDDGHLEVSDEQRLYEYYGMGYSSRSGQTQGQAEADRTQQDVQSGVASTSQTSDRTGDDDPGRDSSEDEDGESYDYDNSDHEGGDAMTRSEESLQVGTTTQEAGRARLRKYVTTETETVQVPVRKERAVLEREPITDDNASDSTDGPEITEDEHEVVLHEEQPVVDKVVEPVERVRLGTETTTDQETVSEDVRKEQIEAEGDVEDRT